MHAPKLVLSNIIIISHTCTCMSVGNLGTPKYINNSISYIQIFSACDSMEPYMYMNWTHFVCFMCFSTWAGSSSEDSRGVTSMETTRWILGTTLVSWRYHTSWFVFEGYVHVHACAISQPFFKIFLEVSGPLRSTEAWFASGMVLREWECTEVHVPELFERYNWVS